MTATEIEETLDNFARITPDPAHWLGGDAADQSLEYCLKCAEQAVKEGKGASIEGGYECLETDGCRHCETCGEILNYYLTAEGVMEELAHFRENPPAIPLTPDDAYHIARMVESADDDLDVIKLAEAAVTMIPSGCTAEERG